MTHHNLYVNWDKLPDPQGHADALSAILNDLKPEFRAVGVTEASHEGPKPRFWQSAPTYSEVGKTFVAEIPTWKIGWWLDHRESPVFYGEDEIVPPVTGSVKLIFSVPDYERYMVVNQSRLAYMFGHQPREFKSTDSERIDRATRVLLEALYRLGMHPEGPYPPSDSNWGLGL